MSDDHTIDIDKHVRQYMMVFLALMALTVITVAIYYVDLPPVIGITLALMVATVKAGLVAAIFMHLIDERRFVYWVLMLTVAFFIVLLFLPFLTSQIDQVTS